MTGFNCRIDEAWLYRLTWRHPRFWFLWYLKRGKEWLEAIKDVTNPFIISSSRPFVLFAASAAQGNYMSAPKPTPSMQNTTFFFLDHFWENTVQTFLGFLVFKLLQSSRVRVTRSKIRESCWWNSLPMFDCSPKIWSSSLCRPNRSKQKTVVQAGGTHVELLVSLLSPTNLFRAPRNW